MWAPSRALLSAHSGYHSLPWGDIQNTLTTEEVNAGNAKEPSGVQNNDHPKVYVSWSKHAHFDTRNTGWNDPASQSLDNAFRSDDWWYFVEPQYYVSLFVCKRSKYSCLVRSEPTIVRRLVRLLGLLIGAAQVVTLCRCTLVCARPHSGNYTVRWKIMHIHVQLLPIIQSSNLLGPFGHSLFSPIMIHTRESLAHWCIS
jgi:hypothetical protein